MRLLIIPVSPNCWKIGHRRSFRTDCNTGLASDQTPLFNFSTLLLNPTYHPYFINPHYSNLTR